MKTPTVLVVEDETGINEAYQIVLQRAGYNVRSAFNGKEALEIAQMVEPDLILLDLRMPELNGVEFLKQYKLKDEHPNVKVIVFTNYNMQKEIKEAFELGATRYVLKAWASPKELEKLVRDTLKAN